MRAKTRQSRGRFRALGAIGAFLVALLIGGAVALGVGDALGIRTEPSEPMQEAGRTEPVVTATVPPLIRMTTAVAGPRLTAAAAALDDAYQDRATAGEATLQLSVGSDPDDESYRIDGDPTALSLTAAGEAGAARGIYDLAAAVREGRDITSMTGQEVTSRLPLRMADLGAVGVVADPAQWEGGTDYSHASKAFADVFRADAPYVDTEALARATTDFDEYLTRIVAEGYNAIAFPGLIEFVTFAGLEGDPVYPADDPHIDRAIAIRNAFIPLWDRAAELGVKVFLRTDMLTLTEPLEQYLRERFGSLDVANPELWEVYTAALDELYEAAPALDGVLIRIGEAGRIYDLPGWDYYSALAVTTVDGVRAMLTALTGQAEESGREVIFRTWSVGVGAVGDMHTNVNSYDEVLSGIDSRALIVSTKYTLGDFYSWLPLNDTLLGGEQRRIVEFQSRREFENNGAFPNDLGAEYQWALQRLLAGNPRIEGVWVWEQDGGPWRAGPMILVQKAGFWQLADLNSRLAVRLARDPDTDPSAITAGWARQWFSDDPDTVAAIVQAMTLSRDAIKTGMYIEPFAEKRVFAIGLEPPPMMWIFEWDILTGDSAALDVIYAIARDDLTTAIDGGAEALDTVTQMQDLVTGTDAGTWRDPDMRQRFVDTLAYERSTLELLGAYRSMFLHQAAWHDTLSPDEYAAWEQARDEYEGIAAAHLAQYGASVDYPAYNLEAAALGVERADRDLAMAWAARVLLLGAAAWLLVALVRRRSAPAAQLRAAITPWRAADLVAALSGGARWWLAIVPAVLLVATRAVQTSLLAGVHLLLILGAWALFCGVLLLLARRSAWPMIAAVGGVIILRCVLALAALSVTGPGGYWFAFWTDPIRRTAYITVAFALFVWVFVAAAVALAHSLGSRRSTGVVLSGIGAALAIPAAIIAMVGLEQSLTVWNDQLGLLPWGLARILGITVYLDIPPESAAVAAVFGAVVLVLGLVLALPGHRQRSAASFASP
ncbi:hypothetical protein [Microbacterium sp. ZW T5_56]|uniref:hypothetical protein n=1 Tax=Microbacterium sp. ZW T5_56 TaxID=3378081 RepID=UPI003854A8E0